MVLTIELADGSFRKEEMLLPKGLKPFSYWFQFALATKLGVQLTHAEMSVIKYRMVEFWNKSMALKINQDLLFTDTRIQYALALPAKSVDIHFDKDLKDRTLYEIVFKEFYADFYVVLKDEIPQSNKRIQAEEVFNLVIERLN